MRKYIAFLRAINVGGHNVKMEALRKLFAALGLASVETFIASGNVIFESETSDRDALQREIEDQLLEGLGFPVATFLRTLEEVGAIARYKPLSAAEMESLGAFSVGFLAEPLSEEAEGELAKLRTDVDSFRVRGREVYWLCAKKQSASKFSNMAFERRVGVAVTFRGGRTVARLAARYPAPSSVLPVERQSKD